MNFGDVPTWIGSGIALIVGAAGIWFGARGYSQAKKSNRIAGEARDQAAEANRIAETANRLSEQANALAGRTVAAQEEHWFVDLEVSWDADLGILVIRNKGSHDAREAAVTVSASDVHEVIETLGDVRHGTEIGVPLTQIVANRRAFEAEERTREQMTDTELYFEPRMFHVDLKITVSWKTGMGFPRSQEFAVRAT